MGRWGLIPQGRTPMLFAGRLRHKIDIVQVTRTQDASGGVDLSQSVVYARVSASVEAVGGSEGRAGDSFVSTVTHQIVIRYIGAAPSWQSLTDYLTGAVCKDSNNNLQQAQADGVSGVSAPTWNHTLYGFTSDGDPSTGLVWKNYGTAPIKCGVTSAMQIIFQNRTFQIESVQNPDERNKLLILMCTELNDGANQQPIIGNTQPVGGMNSTIDGGTF